MKNARFDESFVGRIGEVVRLACDDGFKVDPEPPFEAVCKATTDEYGTWTTEKSCKSMLAYSVLR